MMRGEFALLVRDKLPEAERIVRERAAPNSLTEKIMNGWFGYKSITALCVRKAREIAIARVGY